VPEQGLGRADEATFSFPNEIRRMFEIAQGCIQMALRFVDTP
jgi:hypothetical protein